MTSPLLSDVLYRNLARPLLFRRDAEDAHEAMLARLARWHVGTSLVEALLHVDDARWPIHLWNQRFATPLGLAAGLDKGGTAWRAWSHFGLGFMEIGTVTPLAQPGNPRPRLFRLVADAAIINRMGFNSEGAAIVAARLPLRGQAPVPLGINVGRNRDTPNERAADDYAMAIEVLRDHADYLTVNVSSPNTAGLRQLQTPQALRQLLGPAIAAAKGLPLLVKLSPDDDAAALTETAIAAVEAGAAGIIATNTTLQRKGLHDLALAAEAGGLSGPPMRDLATAAIRTVYRAVGHRVPIIGVGGVDSAEAAYEKVRAGATLLQLYTGLVYHGPTVVHAILSGLRDLLDRDGVAHWQDVVGVDA